MDDLVAAALVKWPNVPHCHGWLGLDARGNWYLRDESVQAAGPFETARGSLIEHARLREFIARNYAADASGAWFFQNGPQRVYVDLEVAPWIWRLTPSTGSPAPSIASHTGRTARFESAWFDDAGRLYLATDIGFGLVHSVDMEVASHAVEAGRWMPTGALAQSLPERFGYQRTPRP
ncbi:MAG: DUF2946 family protein [Burkholderiaceae bacterium]